ncbi:MAG: hypothetical protein GKS03_06875 [Alphaproteobacteria bacterium]|nr:hypothetical protein [Alphaproteobacteria bacterium]
MSNPRAWTASDIRSELTKIESLIVAAGRLIGEGRLIDLSALEGRTHEACDAAVALEGQTSRDLLPDLERVISNLDTLAEQLATRFGDLPNLQNETAPSAAASAYGRSSGAA